MLFELWGPLKPGKGLMRTNPLQVTLKRPRLCPYFQNRLQMCTRIDCLELMRALVAVSTTDSDDRGSSIHSTVFHQYPHSRRFILNQLPSPHSRNTRSFILSDGPLRICFLQEMSEYCMQAKPLKYKCNECT